MSEQAKTPEGSKKEVTTTKTELVKIPTVHPRKSARFRKEPWKPPKYNLDEIDLAILKERMAKPSIPILDIAQKLDLNRDTVGDRLASDRVQKVIADQAKHVQQVLQESVDDAARVLRDLLESTDQRIRFWASKTILEGLGKLKSFEVHEVNTTAEEASRKLVE